MCFYKQSPGKELICVDLHWRCLKLGEVNLILNIVPLYVWGAQTHLFSVPVFALLNWEYKMQLSSLMLLRPLEICGQRGSPRSHCSICRGLTTLEVLLIRSTSKTLTSALIKDICYLAEISFAAQKGWKIVLWDEPHSVFLCKGYD